jgi:DeoR/GlpR family transcriptional regulator of sugar metabolism
MEGTTSLEELSRQFGVSTATIRRDVKELEKKQNVVQTVGGGILYRQSGETQTGDPRVAFIDEKIRIAEYCTELVKEQDEIIVGPGTTTFIIGRILTGITDRRFRIITNSLDLAIEASQVVNVETVILGGEVYARHSLGFTSHDDYFSTCHTRHTLIISADGIDLDQGITVFDPRYLSLLQKMVSVSSTIVLAADSSKIGKATFNTIGAIDIATILVTDGSAPADACRKIERRGVTVVRV